MEVSLKSKEIAFVRMKTMNCYIRECSITDGKQWPLVGEGIFVKYYQLYQILNLRSILYHSIPGLQVQQVGEPEPVAEGGCLYFLSWVLCIVLRWSTLQGEGGRLSFLFLLSFLYCVSLSSCLYFLFWFCVLCHFIILSRWCCVFQRRDTNTPRCSAQNSTWIMGCTRCQFQYKA